MDRFARWLVKHPWPVLLAHLATTALLGWYALQLRIDSSLASVLASGDPAVAYYEEVRQTFGSDEVAVVGVLAPDIFAPDTLEKIARITRAIEKIDGVERVLSITNAVDPAADVFHPPPLLANLPPSREEVEALKKKLRETPLYGRNLVSDDFTGVALNVFLKNLTDVEYADLQIDERIAEVLRAEAGPEQLCFTGASHLKQAATALMRRDLFRFTPVAVALVLVVFWLSFRTLRGVLLPMASVLMALVWTLGVMVLLGKPITLGTFVLPPLLLVIGSSYSLHVMARYYQQLDATVPRDELVLRAFRQVWVPVSISAVTTVIGFAALMVNSITAIWDLGLFSVIGLSFLTVTSLAFLPATLEILAVHPRGATSRAETSRLSRLLAQIGRGAYARQRTILAGALVLSLLSLAGTRRIRVDSDFISYFDPTSEVRQANEIINQRIVGSNPFSLVIEATEPGMLKRWEVLKLIKDLQAFLHSLPGVTSSISLVDYLELLERGLNRGGGGGDIVIDEKGQIVESAPQTFWENPKNLAPVLELVVQSPETFKGVVTRDFGKSNLLVRTRLSGSRDVETTLARIGSYIAQHFPATLHVRPTGNLVLLTGTTSDLVRGQIESVSIALGVIFAIMALMFLSARVGFLAILPNVIPILLFYGLLGCSGIYLNLGTSLIATIALGVAVDSAVHYMSRLSSELKGETNQLDAIVRTLGAVGVPIFYSTVALFFGFLTFAWSSFVPIQNFGILTGATLLAALCANLVLLPTLLATTKIITIWDLVSVKLGKDPTRTIPLLAGLRPHQARIVVLMGEIRQFAPGDAIVRRGERGNEMYVIVQGSTDVWIGSGEERRRVAVFRRGDVFGEMALVRHDERTADVIAAEPVEALAVDERFLERIQRRYPRIASKVFLNLTRILSDRLERTTNQFLAAR